MTDAIDSDLAAMAQDELARALRLTWRGRDVLVDSTYIWAEKPGGDILCEVHVYGGPSRYDDGARASRVIPKDRT